MWIHLLPISNTKSVFSLLGRCVGTFLGLIAGLLVWYIGIYHFTYPYIFVSQYIYIIGSGNGNGNPYGLAATFGVVLIPVLFIRNNMPLAYLVPAIMFNVCTFTCPIFEV